MTRKRRISEAVACDIRDPLNLKAVTSDPEPYIPEESAAKVPNVQSGGGESSQNSNTSHARKVEEFRTRHESLSQHKSLPPFTTPPRLIKPLLARNPKDPLDLLGLGNSEEAAVPVSRTHKDQPLSVAATAGKLNNNLLLLSGDNFAKPVNTRKRRRNRSVAVAEVECRPQRTTATGDDAGSTSNVVKGNVGKVPTSDELVTAKSAKKSRRCNRRKRKRRHGGKKKTESNDTSSVANVTKKAEDEGKSKDSNNAKASVTKKRAPSFPIITPFLSPLSLLCSSIRSLFSKSRVLHIGACGDNGFFSVQLATQYGAECVVGIDRCMKRIRIARRMLGSLSGQLSLAQSNSTVNSAGDQQKKSKIYPRSFPVCFGPIGPDINSHAASTLLRAVEFSYVSDYTNISMLCDESPPSLLWDTVVLQESVVSSILCNPSYGPTAVHRLLTRISNNLRTGGHIILVLGRLRWQKHLKTLRSLPATQPITESVVQDSNEKQDATVAESSTGIPPAAQLHPLTQLRKFFRFRLVRRITGPPLPLFRPRRPSSVSWRGFSPFLTTRHGHRHHSVSHTARPQSLLSTTSSLHVPIYTGNSGENGKNIRRHGGSHRIVFVLQKKNEAVTTSDKSSQEKTSEQQPTTDSTATTTTIVKS